MEASVIGEDVKGGEEISTPVYSTKHWIPAEVPGTVLASLVKNHFYNDPYFGTNIKDISGEQFQVPWWYRTDFDLQPGQAGKTVLISFNGLNYKAKIWLNGKQIVTSQTANGAYRRH